MTAIFYLFTHLIPDLRQERTYTASAAVTCLEETVAHVSGERAPASSIEELEKLVDGVLPQYTLLYGPPDKQVRAHQKKDIWRAIEQGSTDPGGPPQTEHPLPLKKGGHSPLVQEDGGGP
ncbi:hypothetical protein NDU88_006450 [Pleurodeles waltl]|uniref:Uncharacterized protein n=1 Tax=Pleurodeles waltl TaxID=8319 RepID=A0AAV7VLY8_PLEWA|nr:hypothetical protein NDU88_006450 [Pleurodeles waltl]